ncbi:OmpA family protein [Microscilla marina]|uniref:OmpA family protein n=1 Tax=Microscilla marina ATCC 23134 TaxID=313606 RepID=A1ZJ10_MICM2|nr:OmpA family protein [Microscilla marina]EAY29546.1 OmpA family protein [Microscilla marina ATCC 23134]
MNPTYTIVSWVLGFVSLSLAPTAQNLVPNPGFEEFKSCPATFGEISQLKHWESYHYTPDFFHACATKPQVKTPKNFFGIQKPASGKGYVGLTAFHAKAPHEVIGVKLLKPLKKGVRYEASIKVSLAEKYSKYAINKLGLLFTNEPKKAYNAHKMHVKAVGMIKETNKWVNIGGVFTPDKDYAYMMIGNFFDWEYTDRLMVHPSIEFNAAYYYIDDVYVAKQGTRLSFSSIISVETGEVYRLDNVSFDFNKATFRPFSKVELDKLVKLLKQYPAIVILITGHTDNIGTDTKNFDLSQRRAQTVANYLLTKGGVDPDRIRTEGMGETQPVMSNNTNTGRALNRRVEFRVLKK